MSLLANIKKANDAFAVGLQKLYGTPITIWLCILFSVFGAFVTADVLNKMTFWSNAVQLVFCPLSIYVSGLALKKQSENKKHLDALHDKVDAVHEHLGISAKES